MLFGSATVASRAGIEASIPSIVVRNPGINPMGKSKHIALVMGKA